MEETKDRTDETIETTDTTEKTENEKKAVSQENEGQKNSSPKKIEHYCAMCRRPESTAGKMVDMVFPTPVGAWIKICFSADMAW